MATQPSDIVWKAFTSLEQSHDKASSCPGTILQIRKHAGSETMKDYVSGRPDFNDTIILAATALDTLVARNYPEPMFHAKLCEFIFGSALLERDDERMVALWVCANDLRMPYRHYNVVRMSDERFSTLAAENLHEVTLVQQIAQRRFRQKTEEASAVLEVIDAIEDTEARTVVLALYVDAARDVASRA